MARVAAHCARVSGPVGCVGFLPPPAHVALSACTTDGQPNALAAQPRGASVAFESIDGPPQGQFYKLVQNLNDEAQARRLAVMSRETPAVYHVRGYLAAKVVKGQTTISWAWDVFDADEHRALRITGEEAAKGKHHDVWAAADDAMLHRIARSSMDQLAVFLTSPAVAAPEAATVASIDNDSSPEAAGIFRIFRPHADPVSGEAAATPAAGNSGRRGAVAAPAPDRHCGGVRPRDREHGRVQPVNAGLRGRKLLRDNASIAYCPLLPALI